MKQIADLHIHSRYSMATSKDGTPEMLDLWARKKGITVLGTGDMTHPVWRQELKAQRPQTYAAVQNALSKVTDAQVNKIINVYKVIWK